MVEGGPTTVRQLLEGGVVYHQRQSLQLCAVHTLNNLFCEPPALSPATPARRQRRVNTARPRARLAAGNDGEPGTAARVRGFNKEPLFDKPRLDAIAEGRQREFAPGAVFNPHKSALGLGNYDVVVIESGRSPPCCPAIRCPHTAVAFRSAALGWGVAAVAEMGCGWTWWDQRKGAAELPGLLAGGGMGGGVVGLVINIQTKPLFGAWRGNHWYTIRRCGGFDFNLDSKLSAPEVPPAMPAALSPIL